MLPDMTPDDIGTLIVGVCFVVCALSIVGYWLSRDE